MIKQFKFVAAISVCTFMVTTGAMAQKWTPLKHRPPNISAYNPTLLTDGTVLVQNANANGWYKLTPDINGSYLNGTWSTLAQAPTGFGPLYYASQVMTDGRVFMMGGEYNMGSGTVWSNKGAIYDPAKNTWTSLTAPAGWANIGDMGSVTLPNGKLLLANPFSNQFSVFDPATNTFTASASMGKGDVNDEEGLTLLPNGNVLTVDTTANHTEIFNFLTMTWSSAGDTPASLVGAGEEIGPQVLRPDGTVICFGGGSHNCIFDSKTSKWSQAPDFPIVNGVQMCCADAPAILLPNGNVLVMTGPANFGSGSNLFEWDGAKLNAVPRPADAPFVPSFVGNFLMLPTGEVMYCGQSSNIELYTPAGKPNAAWAPTITSWPTTIKPGQSYTISGTQFNGLSGCSAYGDDQQNTTNYPIIRITNKLTGHVQYCREFNPSTMAICTGSKIVSTHFTAPTTLEAGDSTLEVVTNGIASIPVPISSSPLFPATSVSVFQGVNGLGSVSDVWATDGTTFSCLSVKDPAGQAATVEADFTVTAGTTYSFLGISASASAPTGSTGMLYVYDWVQKTFVLLQSVNLSASQTALTGNPTGATSRYIGPGGSVRVLVRALMPTRVSSSQIKNSVDTIQIVAY